ncbi:hypothetical protein P9112_002338 [Eukaryota sp. TZLM1-RC]
MASWPTIESDPAVFTELLQKMGVSGLKVEELYSLDEDTIKALPEVFGLVFLFKWSPGVMDYQPSQSSVDSGVYFARQMITNACATQALINILFNIPEERLGDDKPVQNHITFSEELMGFKHHTRYFDPEARGSAINNYPFIREAHQSFERPAPVAMETSTAGKEEDTFHYVAYVPHKDQNQGVDHVFELDGLSKYGPVDLGEVPQSHDWVSVAVPSIQNRIQLFESSEIRFSVLAVVADCRTQCREKISKLDKQIETLTESVGESQEVKDLRAQRARLIDYLEAEERKFERWRVENVRRRHDYVPFLARLLELLAQRNELFPAIERAKKSS